MTRLLALGFYVVRQLYVWVPFLLSTLTERRLAGGVFPLGVGVPNLYGKVPDHVLRPFRDFPCGPL